MTTFALIAYFLIYPAGAVALAFAAEGIYEDAMTAIHRLKDEA